MKARKSRNRPARAMLPLVLGGGFSAAFFFIVHEYAGKDSYLWRYTMGHPVNVTEVILFFWGIASLLCKYAGLGREWRALDQDWLPAHSIPQPVSTAADHHRALEGVAPRWRDTVLGRRLEAALHYVKEKRSASTLEAQLRYLAETDAEAAHGGYAFVRLLAWMIPILGFLGTVLGITMAIANVSPSELESSLGLVTGGLAVAFDTTGVALILSIILMTSIFVVERSEQQLLAEVEARAEEELAHRFLANEAPAFPGMAVIQAASEAVIAHTRSLVEAQANLWSQSLEKTLAQVREHQRAHEEHFQRLLDGAQARWVDQGRTLERSTARMEELRGELGKVAEALVELIDGEGRLVKSQERLAENLGLLHQSRGLDEAVHSLTAAIHLLTIRHQPPIHHERKSA